MLAPTENGLENQARHYPVGLRRRTPPPTAMVEKTTPRDARTL